MGNLVAIVGRPNVGKSTLFNRLTKSRQAIVSNEAGTTRDRQYGKCEWNGKEFSVVDTGGWVVNSDDIFEEEIRKQVIIATEEADLVLFLCDINNGVTAWDQDVAQILRRAKLPVLLVANKADDGKDLYDQYEFWSPGQQTLIPFEDNLSNKQQYRFQLYKMVDEWAKENKLGISMKKYRGFKTLVYYKKGPLNFWLYAPQHSEDQAPKKIK